jgi:putative radical SAM enzyme (TIGR03279 family)
MRSAARGIVARVAPHSPAAKASLSAGDAVLSINGHALQDILDYQFYAAEEELEFLVQRGNAIPQTARIVREYGADLGLEFTELTFNGIHRCRNRCEFCFIQQMPPGLRKTLYVRDDDYRYSFLFGNFITLTNLDEEDWERLSEQGLSPLYVSVHATDPRLRASMLGTPQAADILEQIARLGELGIAVHTQIVVTPGLNDGPILERTVQELAALYPTVRSIGVVPVGLTRFHSGGLRTLTPAEAARIVQWLQPLQRQYRREQGVGLVYASDEMYLLAGLRVPSARSYDGFPQLANGVGLTRRLLDNWSRAKHRPPQAAWHGRTAPRRRGRKLTIVCGTLIAPVLQPLSAELAKLTQVQVVVQPVANQFFGATVTVSGLLTAQDVVAALRGSDLGDCVILPRAMFDASGEVTLDDRTQADISRELGASVAVAENMAELLQLESQIPGFSEKPGTHCAG